MIKLIGAILITSGTIAWGMSGVMRLKGRVKSLSAMTSALEIMKSEICDRLTPMPELLEQMAAEASYPATIFFENAGDKMSSLGNLPFSAVWRQALKETPELMLTSAEELVLAELGLSLGRYNIDEQRTAFTYAQRRLEALTKKAVSDRDANSKLHAFLGVAAGIFAVIILL